jgi:hypothetical protein
MAGAGAGGKTYADFMAAQRARLVTRADLTKFKTGTGSDSFHSYDPREKVRRTRRGAAESATPGFAMRSGICSAQLRTRTGCCGWPSVDDTGIGVGFRGRSGCAAHLVLQAGVRPAGFSIRGLTLTLTFGAALAARDASCQQH